jgi:hypothetical protein
MISRTASGALCALAMSALVLATERDARAGDTASDAAPPAGEAATHAAPLSAPSPTFGDRGEVVIGSDANASVVAGNYEGNHSYFASIEPSVDYFVARRLSIGGSLTFAYSASNSSTSWSHQTSFGVAPRVGYDIPLSDHFSLWPRASIDFTESNFAGESGGTPYTSNQGNVSVSVFVPVLFHPAPHFFVGFGPYAGAYVTNGDETFVGAKLTLGGWVGG